MKTILVTGGAGFIGSNFIRLLLAKRVYSIVNLDLLTYAGNEATIKEFNAFENYTFIKGNICDEQLVNQIMRKYDIDIIVNFAAESHVDRSIENPSIFLETNVLGTQVLLSAALEYWMTDSIGFRSDSCFFQVSTDEVYGALGRTGKFTETTPLSPNSPYSASKASADMMVHAYGKTYGLPIQITRCSNNYGPYQYPEKLIPLMIHRCKQDLYLPVYGDGKQVRDWLHVMDHCDAILTVLEKGERGEVYNIGGNNEIANIEIVQRILSYFQKDSSLIKYVTDRKGHDRRYAIDNTKITSQLLWAPKYTFKEGLLQTFQWYDENEEWLQSINKTIAINNN